MKDPVYYRRFDYDRALLPNEHLRALEADVTDLEQARLASGASIGYPGWPLLYYHALCSLDPSKRNVIVETGTNHGCSTIMLAQALRDLGCGGSVHTVEIDPEVQSIARRNAAEAGLEQYVEFHVGSSRDVLPGLVGTLETIDLAFLDGSHLEDDVLFEFATVHGRLSPGALVIFDNTYQIAEPGEDQRVNGALRQIHSQYGGNLINLRFVSWYTPGLAVWQETPPLD